MSIYFQEQSWPELKEAVRKNTLILLPIGTIEEHGKHLPVSTDAVIAAEIARCVAEKVSGKIPVLVMPTVWSGYSMKEMTRWPGTMRIRTRVVMDLVFDICSSLIEMGFKKIVLIDCHGHHGGLLNVVTREIADKYRVYMALTNPASMSVDVYRKVRKSKPGGSIHGGEWETSIMLYLNQAVNMKKATNEDLMKYSSDFIPCDGFSGRKSVFLSTWGIQKSKTGIYGDPTVAAKSTGRKIMDAIVKNYEKFLTEFYELRH